MQLSSNLSSVVGLQFGDEGKGQLVDQLTQNHDLIVRYNGGANAGHVIRTGGKRFVLHQTPVGCLTKGKIGVLGNGVVLHVPALLEELSQLNDAGICDFELKISASAHLVMPYHFIEESLRDLLAIQLNAESLGTTLKGIGPCYADKASRDTGIRVSDLYKPDTLRRRLTFIIAVKNAVLASLANEIGKPFEPLCIDAVFDDCLQWARQLRPYIVNTGRYLLEQERSGQRILFEGANASGLDLDFGTYPFVTSSNGSNLGMSAGSGFLPDSAVRRYGVLKTYTSRVGSGPFPTELFGEVADRIRQEGSEFGSTTSRPRRVGWLDLPSLQETVRLNRISDLVLTGLFVLAKLDTFNVCTGYEGGHPVLVQFDVQGDLSQTGDELPGWCVRLIDLIESNLVPVAAYCVGRSRNQLVWRSSERALPS